MAATLATLRTRARQAADMVNSAFISDAEALSMLNASYQELYDIIVDIHEDYFVTTSSFSLTSNDAGVSALPVDFLKLRGLDYLQGSDYLTVLPFNWANRNTFTSMGSWPDVAGIAYRIMGSNIRIEPNDEATGTYRLWYVPAVTLLSADADVVNTAITRAGWEEYIVVDTAMKMKQKEESDVSTLAGQKSALIRRINSAASNRDADQPLTVTDVRSVQGSRWQP